VPLSLVGRVPAVTGRIDGELATLAVDTGCAAGLVVDEGFAKAHAFAQKWHAVLAYAGIEPGPVAVTLIGHAASLELGVLGVAQPVGWIASGPVTAGDGLLGDEILRRYDVIIDFRHGRLWLQPNHSADKPDEFDRSGLAIANDNGVYTVGGVLPQGAAWRAGLRVGDLIEMVSGEKAGTLGLSEIRGRLTAAAGSGVTFGVRRDGDYSSYRVVLADPWPAVPDR
jgi:hypothetical protein